MLNIDFYNMFLNVDFDSILSETNNPLINSKEFYLNYKNEYFDQTNKNYSRFLRYNSELQRLRNTEYKKTATKYTFLYLDQNKIESLKNDLKSIILEQNILFNNFKYHIEMLTKEPSKFISQDQETNKQRGLMSFFNKTKKVSIQIEKPPALKRSRSNASTKSNRSIKSIQSFKSFRE